LLVRKGHLVFSPADPIAFRDVLPQARRLEVQGKEYVALKHDLEAVQVLRNMGINAPSPVNYGWEYPGRYVPYQHQRETVDFLTIYRRGFVLNEMGTAKTCSAIWAAEYLMQQGLVRRVLVVAPRSCLKSVWADEIFQTTMKRPVAILQGSRERRRKLFESEATYLIINHDALGTIADLVRKDRSVDLVIIDESAVFRNGQTGKYAQLKRCLRPETRLWMMSGAPCPNAPTDAWAQARLVRPETVPPYFTSFKRETMDKISMYKWVPRHDSDVKVHDALQPAIRFAKKDCLDLPPITYQNRECELTPEQKRLFKEMRNDLHTRAEGHTITAVNAAAKLTKLLQICAGVVYDNTGAERIIEASPRLEALLEIIEQNDRKVIVWAPYVSVLNHLTNAINKRFGSDNYARSVRGSVSDNVRHEIFTSFSDENSPTRVLVAHPKTAAHGLTLVSANTCIWYAPFFSPELYRQANERINRPGQKHPMTVLHMGGTALEWGYFEAVRMKNGRETKILDMYKNLIIDM
jgi:SNF2 family DNA or RNA helicase